MLIILGLCPIPRSRSFLVGIDVLGAESEHCFVGALPHTPLKELFEKSSLRIFKNF